jgi:uncharacterized phage-like protein YoqJ
MSACTFFGHRDCPADTIKPRLRQILVDLIENYGVDMFYVGQQGCFDGVVHRVLKELKNDYPDINFAVVLAYMPGEKAECADYSDTMLPEGIESVHPRYALSWRNNWMLKQADYVVTYITHSWGGAYQYVVKAKRQGKMTINLALTE